MVSRRRRPLVPFSFRGESLPLEGSEVKKGKEEKNLVRSRILSTFHFSFLSGVAVIEGGKKKKRV